MFRPASDQSEMKEVWSMDSPGISSSLERPPTILAGLPTAVVRGGTSMSTREPAPTFAPSPILTFPRIVAPAPISTPSPIFGCRSPTALPVPPSVTLWRIDTLLPTTAVSPITTPTSEIRDWSASASGRRRWFQRTCATRWAWMARNPLVIGVGLEEDVVEECGEQRGGAEPVREVEGEGPGEGRVGEHRGVEVAGERWLRLGVAAYLRLDLAPHPRLAVLRLRQRRRRSRRRHGDGGGGEVAEEEEKRGSDFPACCVLTQEETEITIKKTAEGRRAVGGLLTVRLDPEGSTPSSEERDGN
ncbi:unnamed protein product [Spirodela intermedia]|uniref:Uncharacterized protein n=1 Tax=Spirodela intermedia TaxID=51605 RepID=A0A7I8LFZ9_SPIIN|nr:unnamed protein product [Spirodela intermedia]